ncbi:MAG: BatD family protein [Gammaproteobacteria bacterium]
MVTKVFIALFASLLWSPQIQAATLTAQVDRKSLFSDEYLTLTLTLENSDTRLRAEGVNPNIDLTLLSDAFELGTPRVNNRFNINKNRGRSSSTLTIELFPKKAGEFLIPPFEINDTESNALTIQVQETPADKIPDVFIKTGLTKDSVWIHEQVIAYLDLYHRVELTSAKLGGKLDAKPTQMELAKLPQRIRKEIKHGISYNVTRIAWAITPTLTESYTLYFPDVWVETNTGQKIRLPFYDTGFSVRPLPKTVPNMILVGKPMLSQTTIKPMTQVNAALPFDITLTAPVNGKLIPKELPHLPFPNQVKYYLDSIQQTTEEINGVINTTSTYKGYLLPLTEGKITLPDIELPYFDPETGEIGITQLTGQTLEITSPLLTVREQPVFNKPRQDNTASVQTSSESSHTWQILTLFFAILWVGTIIISRNRTAKKHVRKGGEKTRTSQHDYQHPLIKELLDAFGTRTIEQGLKRWEKQHGVDENMLATIKELQSACYSEEKEAISPELTRKIKSSIQLITSSLRSAKITDPWSPWSTTRTKPIKRTLRE